MKLDLIWYEFLKIINEEVGSRIVETWFKAVIFSQWDNYSKTVYLKAPNTFVKDWISSNYMHLFKMHLSRLLGEESIEIIFLDNSKTEKVLSRQSSNLKANLITHNKEKVVISKNELVSSKIQFNKNFTFDTFVVGPNNSLAFAAAQAVAEKPGILYNPLFIYGDSGLGKTHLLHAVAYHCKINFSNLTILYQSADRFVNEFINAIRFDKVHTFENKYKKVDILLIDDIQFISNKEQTQEVFFHIFNVLYESHKQIIFSSDSLPKDIEGLASRLQSRLYGGLIADIQPPSLETKIAILKKKAELYQEQIADEVANFIATVSSLSVRELEGLLIRVLAFASLTSQPVSLELAKRVLSKTAIKEPKKETIDLQFIAQKVARYYGYNLNELRSNKRFKSISLARHVSMYFMKKFTDFSLSDIGAFFRRKDHSTVLHAIEKIEQYKKKDSNFYKDLEKLEDIITRN